jgi:hypothetical protein
VAQGEAGGEHRKGEQPAVRRRPALAGDVV